MIILGQLIDLDFFMQKRKDAPEGAALISINITLHLQKKKKGRTEKA